MAKTIDEGFNTFLSWLTPTKTETEKAKNHRASIEACLKTNFGLTRFFRTGSFGNGTSISGYSDVDYFASIPRENLKKDSNITLRAVNKVLNDRFPNTGVRIDSPAVVVPFGSDPSETTEIVPADFLSNTEPKDYVFDIPNSSGGWKRSAPELHKAYVDIQDGKLSDKVKPLIRLIKAWKFYRDVSISSFFIEMFVANYAASEKSIVYTIDIKNVFAKFKTNQFFGIQDPLGISGTIPACENETDRHDALIKLDRAVTRSENAREAERKNRISEAFDWLNKLYADKFPGYN